MTGKELFEIYQRCTAQWGSTIGIVCGYGTNTYSNRMLMHTTDQDAGWRLREHPEAIKVLKEFPDNGRYYWIGKEHLIMSIEPIKPILTSDIAEKYIFDHFPTITDDEKDIYINIFMEGTKYIKDDTK